MVVLDSRTRAQSARDSTAEAACVPGFVGLRDEDEDGTIEDDHDYEDAYKYDYEYDYEGLALN